jgi:DNA-binding PadR family transcriptional regulator
MERLMVLAGEEAAEAIRALNDECRRQILSLLKSRRMSTSEIIDFLEREHPDKCVKPQTVRYHLKELEHGGLIRQDGYEPAGEKDTHIMKKIWRAAAENIFIATSRTGETAPRPPTKLNITDLIHRLGFETDERTVKEATRKYVEWDTLWRKGRDASEESLSKMAQLDPEEYLTLRRLLSVILLPDADYAQYWEVSRAVSDLFRKIYLEGIGKNPEVY